MDVNEMRATLDGIPFTCGLGITLDSVAPGEVRMTLPDRAGNRNLAGTVHAGLLYTFGETLAGVAAGMPTLDRAFPFARRADIHYRRPARGAVQGVARVAASDLRRVLEDLTREGRSELTVRAELSGKDGQVVAEMDVDYAFRALSPKSETSPATRPQPPGPNTGKEGRS